MTTDLETRTRIAAMSAAEAAIENDSRDPFRVLEGTCFIAAARLGVDPLAVFDVADGILIEDFADRHIGPEPEGISVSGAGGRRVIAG
jgi:hypothetical protein